MLNEVLEFNQLLCTKIEPDWLRRNSSYYGLVSYVNNLTCLFIGEQYADVALFIRRIDSELERVIDYGLSYEYFGIARKYIQRITDYLLLNNLLSAETMKLLPEKYLNHTY
jgi:hypothetical protein